MARRMRGSSYGEGKFAVIRDKDGDKLYVKVSATEIASKNRTQTANVSGTMAKPH